MTTTEQLIALMRERHAKGLAKYGVTVDRGDLTPDQWAQHAIEEMLDGAAYLMRLKDTLGQPAKPPMEDADALRIQRDSARADLERLEASHRMLGDAYDAARQDRDHALAKVARLEATLAASRQGPAKASEAPGEGGDSGRNQIEWLSEWLKANPGWSVEWLGNRFVARDQSGSVAEWAWELDGLAELIRNRQARKEAKP